MLTERIALEGFLYGVNIALDEAAIGQARDPEVIYDALKQEAVASFRRVIYGRQLQHVRYPTTWWDAVKDRFLPKFLRRYVVVNYTEIDVKELYPSVVVPEKNPSIVITKMPALPRYWENEKN